MKSSTSLTLLRLLLLPTLVLLAGTVGYMLLEDWSWLDATYMTVITLSTVGFGEVQDLTREGRIFTALLILLGVGAISYMFTVGTQEIVAGQLSGAWRSTRNRRRINRMRDHFILAGYGRVGSSVADLLLEQKHAVVVIEIDTERIAEVEAEAGNLRFVAGSADHEEVLRQAGIDRAAGICFCLSNDADNLLGVLTARTLNPTIFIATRVEDALNEAKMEFAGANEVVSPTSVAAYSMAFRLTQPSEVKAWEWIRVSNQEGYVLETVQLGNSSEFVHRKVGDIGFRARHGLRVLQVMRADRTLVPDVTADTEILPGDSILVMTRREDFTRFCAKV